jgi:hypothetical protein
MTPAQVFDSLTAQEKAKILQESCDAVEPEEIEKEFAWRALFDRVPTFKDLQYDTQDAVLPALRRLA